MKLIKNWTFGYFAQHYTVYGEYSKISNRVVYFHGSRMDFAPMKVTVYDYYNTVSRRTEPIPEDILDDYNDMFNDPTIFDTEEGYVGVVDPDSVVYDYNSKSLTFNVVNPLFTFTSYRGAGAKDVFEINKIARSEIEGDEMRLYLPYFDSASHLYTGNVYLETEEDVYYIPDGSVVNAPDGTKQFTVSVDRPQFSFDVDVGYISLKNSWVKTGFYSYRRDYEVRAGYNLVNKGDTISVELPDGTTYSGEVVDVSPENQLFVIGMPCNGYNSASCDNITFPSTGTVTFTVTKEPRPYDGKVRLIQNRWYRDYKFSDGSTSVSDIIRALLDTSPLFKPEDVTVVGKENRRLKNFVVPPEDPIEALKALLNIGLFSMVVEWTDSNTNPKVILDDTNDIKVDEYLTLEESVVSIKKNTAPISSKPVLLKDVSLRIRPRVVGYYPYGSNPDGETGDIVSPPKDALTLPVVTDSVYPFVVAPDGSRLTDDLKEVAKTIYGIFDEYTREWNGVIYYEGFLKPGQIIETIVTTNKYKFLVVEDDYDIRSGEHKVKLYQIGAPMPLIPVLTYNEVVPKTVRIFEDPITSVGNVNIHVKTSAQIQNGDITKITVSVVDKTDNNVYTHEVTSDTLDYTFTISDVADGDQFDVQFTYEYIDLSNTVLTKTTDVHTVVAIVPETKKEGDDLLEFIVEKGVKAIAKQNIGDITLNNNVFIQEADPVSEGKTVIDGDLWLEVLSDGTKNLYVREGGTWNSLEAKVHGGSIIANTILASHLSIVDLNEIGAKASGWNMDPDRIYSIGTNNVLEISSTGTLRAYDNTDPANPVVYWELNQDGSGSLSTGVISWDVNGVLTIGGYATETYVDNQSNTAENNAKNDLAQKLGYADWNTMVDKTTTNGTIISGDYINTGLIAANAITAQHIASDAVYVSNVLVAGNDVIQSDTEPTNKRVYQIWVDTSVSPPEAKYWDGSAWVPVTTVISGDMIVDGTIRGKSIAAGTIVGNLIAANSIWSGHISSGAIQANHLSADAVKISKVLTAGYDITVSNTEPTSPSTYDVWIDTSVSPSVAKYWDGSAWQEVSVAIAGNMVVTGTITADKLSVSELSAITARVGNLIVDSTYDTIKSSDYNATNRTGWKLGSVIETSYIKVLGKNPGSENVDVDIGDTIIIQYYDADGYVFQSTSKSDGFSATTDSPTSSVSLSLRKNDPVSSSSYKQTTVNQESIWILDTMSLNRETNIYSNQITMKDTSGNVFFDVFDGTVKSGQILPTADNTYDIGSSTNAWANIYAYNATYASDNTFKIAWGKIGYDSTVDSDYIDFIIDGVTKRVWL